MPLTLAQGNMYSTTELQRYVTDMLTKETVILEKLQFEELMGNSLTYDIVATRSGSKFYDVNETIVEDTVVLSQETVTLKRLIGDADIDEFLLRTRSNKMDLKGTVIEDKVKSVQESFLDQFYYGVHADAKGFAGIQALISSTVYNTVHAGATTGTALSIQKLQEAIDLVTGGWKPTHMIMTKLMRRSINKYLDSIGQKFNVMRDQFGNMIEYFRGLQIVTDDHIKDTELAATGAYVTGTGTATTIFILTFAPKAICGVQGSNRVEIEPLGKLETKDATRYRIKWYCGLKFEDLRSCAKVDGILGASTVLV